ncbi:MAG: hypothetical protein FH756_10930 [Firmicutes bacterium]|nr:hypothetical protein [Bacillota bacterium]
MVKVLLATNEEQLDNAIAEENEIELVSRPVYYLEAVLSIAQQHKPDVVVITSWLEGQTDVTNVIYKLRIMEMRVIFIAGLLTPDDSIVKKICEFGVYDILFGEITIGLVINKIYTPTPARHGLSLINKSIENNNNDSVESESKTEKSQILKNIFRKDRSKKNLNSHIKYETQIIPNESIIITGTNTEALVNFIESTKKFLVLVDVDLANSLALQLGINNSKLWQHDWRLGLSAQPARINRKVYYYSIDREVGEEIEKRDIRCLREIVTSELEQKRQVIVNLGSRDDLVPLLSELNLKVYGA